MENCSGGEKINLTLYYEVQFFSLRSMKSSLKDLITLPSWENLSEYWKAQILAPILPIWKGEPRGLCGVMVDPATFIPQYVRRFLCRMELDGCLPVPGNYKIILKVR